jgi:outer membrane protein TolC
VLLLAGLSDCDLYEENSEQTKPVVPGKFQYAAGAPGAENAWPDRQWWRNFASKELADLIDQAAASNQDLQAAVARIAQAEAQSTIAAAPLYPTLGANASASRSTTGPNTGSSSTGRTVVRRQYQGALSAT